MPTVLDTAVQPKESLYGPMMQMMSGFWVSQGIYVAAKLGIADLLREGDKSSDELAQLSGSNPQFLYRVLRMLAGNGIFEEVNQKSFCNTPQSELLLSEPTSLRAYTLMMGEEHYQAWGKLLEGVQTGQTPFELLYDKPVFQYFQENPEASETFNQAMTSFAAGIHSAALKAYDFSPFKTVVDVGGGHGKLLENLLGQYPHLQGVLFDLPHVLEGAKALQNRLGSRLSLADGDFFQSVVPGGDAYILSTVIHDWSDELATRILKNIHQALPTNGTLLLCEHVVKADNQPSPGKLLDINMLVMTQGGLERTEEEFCQLFASAGFELTRIIPTESAVCLIEGRKAQ